MTTRLQAGQELEQLARLLVKDLHTIGTVTYVARLNGYALFEDGVMFGFIEPDGKVYLRTSAASAERFHSLGSTKHPEMPYWSLPPTARINIALLRDLAYEAADTAHIVASFGQDPTAHMPTRASISILSAVTKTLLAA